MKEDLLSALKTIPVSALPRDDWIMVGMALKEEGLPLSTWDAWSKDDDRYHTGECERMWNSFHGSDHPVTGGSIIKLAKEYGWQPERHDDVYDCNKNRDGGNVVSELQPQRSPAESLILYLETLFRPDDHVGYVTEVYDQDGRLSPQKGRFDRTAGELIQSLKQHPDDLSKTIGKWNGSAGAWIRFNALDGNGIKDANVTSFRYALVESDTIPVGEQEASFRRLRLPIAAMVYSGGKSVHAIVHVDAEDTKQFRERVRQLYTYLASQGISIDEQNKNPSRLSRMPGVTRNGTEQRLIATNIGPASWDAWQDELIVAADGLPGFVSLADFVDDPPEPPEALIEGILRRGHKMVITGPSKAGKSFLLMQLCICIAEGRPWINYFEVKQGKVLYVNLEIDKNSVIKRFYDIYDAMGLDRAKTENIRNIEIWNMRGHAAPLNELVPKLIRRMRNRDLDAVVIDPIYKVITGDENNASDMGAFCNQFDKIANETGCSVICCHHHSKGAQGSKRAMDRASGSGVFARDPDALVDIIELDVDGLPPLSHESPDDTGWRMEFALREFKNTRPVEFWFSWPLHHIDTSGELYHAPAIGSFESNLRKSGKHSKHKSDEEYLDAFNELIEENPRQPCSVKAFAKKIGCSERTVRDRLSEHEQLMVTRGFVIERP